MVIWLSAVALYVIVFGGMWYYLDKVDPREPGVTLALAVIWPVTMLVTLGVAIASFALKGK